jgi:hypothetical protein
MLHQLLNSFSSRNTDNLLSARLVKSKENMDAEEAEPPVEQAAIDNTSKISTFCRVKPVAKPTNRIVLEPLDGRVEFRVPRDAAAGCVLGPTGSKTKLLGLTGRALHRAVVFPCCRPVNNSRERYSFSFDGILTPDAKQDEVRHAQLHASSL